MKLLKTFILVFTIAIIVIMPIILHRLLAKPSPTQPSPTNCGTTELCQQGIDIVKADNYKIVRNHDKWYQGMKNRHTPFQTKAPYPSDKDIQDWYYTTRHKQIDTDDLFCPQPPC